MLVLMIATSKYTRIAGIERLYMYMQEEKIALSL